jgi:anti-sigma factor RsiW
MSPRFSDEALRAAYEPALRELTTTHGPDCPTESELFAAVRAEGNEAERLRVLDHALKCPACRRELALVHTLSSGEPRAAHRSFEDITGAGSVDEPVLLAPANGAAVRPGLVRFVWRPIPGAVHYTLEVDATDGTVLFSSPTRDTTFGAPIAPTAVGENRWLIRATLQDGSEKRSEPRVLRVRPS